jgi:hypothetical protein
MYLGGVADLIEIQLDLRALGCDPQELAVRSAEYGGDSKRCNIGHQPVRVGTDDAHIDLTVQLHLLVRPHIGPEQECEGEGSEFERPVVEEPVECAAQH